MTVDNLLAEVVLADGKQVRPARKKIGPLPGHYAEAEGNFGVVTSFNSSNPVGERPVRAHRFPFTEAKAVLRQYGAFTLAMPDELNVWMVTRKAPPCRSCLKMCTKEVVVLQFAMPAIRRKVKDH
jgi:hypothetical protein